ncbi:ROK family transcriptional regulator [Breznakiella homolactica]|uniref:ROK family transcriptional regulator n=1 Tax=Breznakiella homolactica TaxID=2798577 RepID=A0A7T7XN21_9SPIR|nr:ROK family transcriptional regulator [Breznakiella homolactica]QQO09253.1 ROK family transcriptional regulator [Breznakiella homolactica]
MKKNNVGNTDFQKMANQALILDYLRKKGPRSRVDISNAIGLRQSTVTYIINRLSAFKIVGEVDIEYERNPRGRAPVPICINNSYGHILGMELGPDSCYMVVTDIQGAIVFKERISLSKGPKSFIKKAGACYTACTAKIASKGFNILAAGFAVPGIVDRQAGIIKNSPAHGLTEELDFTAGMSGIVKYPFIIENDANCAAQSILWEKSAGDYENSFICFYIKNYPAAGAGRYLPGLSFSLAFNGKLYRGKSGEAGKFLDTAAGQNSKTRISQDDIRRAFTEAKSREELLNRIFDRFGGTISALDLDEVYFGGDSLFDEPWLNDYSSRRKGLQDAPDIRVNPLRPFDAAYGACAGVLSDIYAIPQVGSKANTDGLTWDSLLS